MAAKKTPDDAAPAKKTTTAAASAKKTTSAASAKKTATAAAPAKKPAARSRKPKITEEMIRERAYHISIADPGGSELDHWLAAEQELLAGK